MPPKQTKKTVETTKPEVANKIDIQTIQKEWADNVKEILTIREKLSVLEKNNEELVAKLWELMNKNPINNEVIIEGDTADEKPAPKVIKKKVEETQDETADEKPAIKTTKKKVATETPVQSSEQVEKPVIKTTKKKVVEKPEIEKPEKSEKPEKAEKPAVKKTVAKEEVKPAPVKGKITAPSKGTPKPKSSNSDDEKAKAVIEDSSSDDTDIDSLSSVSSESDASGGEDD